MAWNRKKTGGMGLTLENADAEGRRQGQTTGRGAFWSDFREPPPVQELTQECRKHFPITTGKKFCGNGRHRSLGSSQAAKRRAPFGPARISCRRATSSPRTAALFPPDPVLPRRVDVALERACAAQRETSSDNRDAATVLTRGRNTALRIVTQDVTAVLNANGQMTNETPARLRCSQKK